jgi:hypothetical protein
MNNTEFVNQLDTAMENKQKCLEAMTKYGDNHWWEPDVDPRKFAYYQINEPILIGEFSRFHEAIELLVGHAVWTHEFLGDRLKQEATAAYKAEL